MPPEIAAYSNPFIAPVRQLREKRHLNTAAATTVMTYEVLAQRRL